MAAKHEIHGLTIKSRQVHRTSFECHANHHPGWAVTPTLLLIKAVVSEPSPRTFSRKALEILSQV
jgi:hypothetical protein